MIPSSIIAKMASLGLSETQATAVAEMLSEVERATQAHAQSAINSRRQNDRERKERQRARLSRDITGTDGTAREKGGRASRLAADWKPTDEMVKFAREAGLSAIEVEKQGEKMRDWSLSAPTGKKLDWLATWRGWIRRFLETRTKTNGNHGGVIAALGRLDFGDDDVLPRPRPLSSSSSKGSSPSSHGLLPKG